MCSPLLDPYCFDDNGYTGESQVSGSRWRFRLLWLLLLHTARYSVLALGEFNVDFQGSDFPHMCISLDHQQLREIPRLLLLIYALENMESENCLACMCCNLVIQNLIRSNLVVLMPCIRYLVFTPRFFSSHLTDIHGHSKATMPLLVCSRFNLQEDAMSYQMY